MLQRLSLTLQGFRRNAGHYVGNCLDVLREAGRDQRVLGAQWKAGATGQKLVSLPYVWKYGFVVKRPLTAVTPVAKGVLLLSLCYSLQEHAFSMVTEVTGEALAHGKEVLLTSEWQPTNDCNHA